MSKIKAKLWEAPPHTIAKIAILRSYLFVWFSILGRKFAKQDLWYIDGFAGPGEYKNYSDGSPIAALKAAESALAQTQPWVAGEVHCLFIEENKARFEHLEQRLTSRPINPRVQRHMFHGTFVEGIDWLKQQSGNPLARGSPMFAFIDPFGTSGLSFKVVKELLSRPRSEVLINLDSDGVGRVLKGGDDANYRQNLNDLFGSQVWEQRLVSHQDIAELSRAAVALYRDLLREIPKVDYTFAFEMRSAKKLIDYHLVFASQHPLGLVKMKGEMKKIDQSGEYTFCDAHVGQHNLFRFDEPATHGMQMLGQFRHKTVPYSEIERYALNDSPFENPKRMLKELEDRGLISVTCSKAGRRKGTFPDGSAITLNFHGGSTHG